MKYLILGDRPHRGRGCRYPSRSDAVGWARSFARMARLARARGSR